jgi:hypothetical protein
LPLYFPLTAPAVDVAIPNRAPLIFRQREPFQHLLLVTPSLKEKIMSESQIGIAEGMLFAYALFAFLLFGFGSVTYAVRRYADMRMAHKGSFTKLLGKTFAFVIRLLSTAAKKVWTERKTAQLQDFSLWENPPQYRIAIAHRCLRVGRRRNTRLFVSDYPGNISKGYVKRGSERVDLDLEIPTGPSGDAEFLRAAEAIAA